MKTRVPLHLSQDIRESNNLAGKLAVVTGATSGVGRAIALALSYRGVQLCLIGRNSVALAETAIAVRHRSKVKSFQIDLTKSTDFDSLCEYLDEHPARVDILIHCAGVVYQGTMQGARIEELDAQYATNVRAPYLLTQRLLPLLCKKRGQIVFVNSSVGLSAKRAEVGQYAATKHALRAVADSLREEVNEKGVRVLTVYLGRTATPMQAKLCEQEGREYYPEKLLQPDDVASVVVHCLTLPRTAEVTDISIRPMIK